MPKLRDEVDRMEIAVLDVVFLALIFHFLLSVVSQRYAHSGIILFVTLVCGCTVLGWIGPLICTILEKRTPENIKDAH